MREIKFRGKRVDTGEWICGFYQQTDCNGIRHYIYPIECMDSPDNYEVVPETISQFTGLKDKNGLEIYEGDIVTIRNTYNYEVAFDNCSFILNHNRKENREKWGLLSRVLDSDLSDFVSDFRVLGNIHDNERQ